MPAEGVFVPACRAPARTRAGVIAYVYDAARDASDLVVLDAADFAAPPVATIDYRSASPSASTATGSPTPP